MSGWIKKHLSDSKTGNELKKSLKDFRKSFDGSATRNTNYNPPQGPPPGPPAYTPVQAGAANLYYNTGNNFDPNVAPAFSQPPYQGQPLYQGQPPIPPHAQAPPQFQPPGQAPNQNIPPYSVINPNTLPLPSANPSGPLADDPYSFLANFDTVFLVDDSGSMSGSRWKQTADALAAVIPITTYYDKDGVDIYFLNYPNHPSHQRITSPAQVMEIFSLVKPSGSTPTGQRLNSILKAYIEKFKRLKDVKPLNIIVITDGCPSDDVESVIVQTSRKLDKMEADLTQVRFINRFDC